MLTAIDVFAGAGGMSRGFDLAGFYLVGAYDNWGPAVETYNMNFRDHKCRRIDLSEYDRWEEIRTETYPDLIVGGPPCQDFSPAGGREEGDRATLTEVFARLVRHCQPEYFVMENVARARESEAYRRARAIFKEGGYGLTEVVLNAAYYGVPQRRRRFFCIGGHLHPDGFLDRIKERQEGPDAVEPLSVEAYFRLMGYPYPEHYYAHPRTYERRGVFPITEPSVTIRGTNGRPVPKTYKPHPGDSSPVWGDDGRQLVEPLTTRQRACIQTFPETYKFAGPRSADEQLIGNAVPPTLAEAIASALRLYIEETATP